MVCLIDGSSEISHQNSKSLPTLPAGITCRHHLQNMVKSITKPQHNWISHCTLVLAGGIHVFLIQPLQKTTILDVAVALKLTQRILLIQPFYVNLLSMVKKTLSSEQEYFCQRATKVNFFIPWYFQHLVRYWNIRIVPLYLFWILC